MASYRSAFCEIDITPELDGQNIALQGLWTETPRYAETVESRLKAQLFLLEDKVGKRILIVTADIFAFDKDMFSVIASGVAELGIEPDAVFLNASHTHYAPGTLKHLAQGMGDVDYRFSEKVTDSIREACSVLVNNLREATVYVSQVNVDIGFNRRLLKAGYIEMRPNPDGMYESRTPILLVKTTTSFYLLVNHGCHPTGLGSSSSISADFIGAFRDKFKQLYKREIVVAYLQGAAGNIKHGRIHDNKAVWSKSVKDTQWIGERFASKVYGALLKVQVELTGTINVKSKQMHLPFSDELNIDEIYSLPENQRYTPQLLKNWHNEMSNLKQAHGLPKFLDSTIRTISIGDIAFLGWSAEPVCEFADTIRDRSDKKIVFIAGYTNGLQGYLPTNKMLLEGGYESKRANFAYLHPAYFATGVEELIIDSALDILHTKGVKVDGKVNDHQVKCTAFFVLSSGRCGTKTLAHLLKESTNAEVWHHPEPDLIEQAQQAYWQHIDAGLCFWQHRRQLVEKCWGNGMIYGETDHYMTPFSTAIANEIPTAKFLVLVRDPREFVRSGMRRAYFNTEKVWDKYRLTPQPNSSDYDHFQGLSQFEKVCWLWAETYKYIFKYIEKIDIKRVKIVRFEDLISSKGECESIYTFLGLDGFVSNKTQSLIEEKLNAQKLGFFPHPNLWSAEMHKICWTYVGELATRLGYAKDYQG